MMTHGVVTSMVTPFSTHPDGSGSETILIDEKAWRSAVAFQRDSGTPAIGVAGWFGEGPTLSRKERQRLVALAAEMAGPMRVYADISSNDTARAETYAMDAAAAGADAVIVVTPSYSRPNIAGVRRHVERVTLAVDLPVYVEIDAARTRCCLTAREIAKLARIDGVAGIVDHSTNPLAVECLSGIGKPALFLAASESTCVASAIFGADGFYSGIANLVPTDILRMHAACRDDDFDRARAIHERLLPLILAVEEYGVAALKYAMLLRRGVEKTLRLPLVPLDRRAEIRVEEALASLTSAELEESGPVRHSALSGIGRLGGAGLHGIRSA
jgi:4-hydroxy-tetrahydrodipicolinate synthase